MDAICLLVAGVLRATVPASVIVVAWDHSVEKSRWEERYRIDGVALRLTDARIRSFGAGMEPPPDARLRDGWWTWRPRDVVVPALRLTQSPFTSDYDICWRGRCKPLHSMIATGTTAAPGDVVEIKACARNGARGAAR